MLRTQSSGRSDWPKLLERSDLILCPYPPAKYVALFSAMACEALANGIPLVVPAGTRLETLLETFGKPGAAFQSFEPQSIVAATEQVLDRFDRYADLAYEAGTRWPEQQGPKRLVDELLSLLSLTAELHSRSRTDATVLPET